MLWTFRRGRLRVICLVRFVCPLAASFVFSSRSCWGRDSELRGKSLRHILLSLALDVCFNRLHQKFIRAVASAVLGRPLIR